MKWEKTYVPAPLVLINFPQNTRSRNEQGEKEGDVRNRFGLWLHGLDNASKIKIKRLDFVRAHEFCFCYSINNNILIHPLFYVVL